MRRILYDLYGRHCILCVSGATAANEDDGEPEHEWLSANPVGESPESLSVSNVRMWEQHAFLGLASLTKRMQRPAPTQGGLAQTWDEDDTRDHLNAVNCGSVVPAMNTAKIVYKSDNDRNSSAASSTSDPDQNNPLISRCPALSGSCLAISMMLSSFLIPTNNGNVGLSASEAFRGNPALDSWRMVSRSSDSSANSSTDLRTTSNCPRCEMGGTLMEASNTSENPRSVMCCPRDEVASTKRRRPYNTDTQDVSTLLVDDGTHLGRFPRNEH